MKNYSIDIILELNIKSISSFKANNCSCISIFKHDNSTESLIILKFEFTII